MSYLCLLFVWQRELSSTLFSFSPRPKYPYALLLSVSDSHGTCNVTGYQEGLAAVLGWRRCLDFITAMSQHCEYGGVYRLSEQDSLQVGNPVVGFREPVLRHSSATAADKQG